MTVILIAILDMHSNEEPRQVQKNKGEDYSFMGAAAINKESIGGNWKFKVHSDFSLAMNMIL